MSVFGDFRNVWVQRFPGCELPAAWEEDVRANLEKHKQKVAVLKEELEKEEFYVEYLERLLIDVAKYKTNDNKNDKEKEEEERYPPREEKVPAKDAPADELTVDRCIGELSKDIPPEPKVVRSNSEKPGKITEPENVRPRSNTQPNISNFVTVIEVNGLKNQPQKKVPPKPPPKTISLTSSIDGSSNSSLEMILDEKKRTISHENLEESGEYLVLEEKIKKTSNEEMNILPLEEEEDLPTEEPYYDSVAQEVEYTYIESTGSRNGSTLASGTSSGTDTTESSSAGAAGTTSTIPISEVISHQQQLQQPLSPGKQSNYVNIEYFIKQRYEETRSSSVDESEDDEVPPLLRTLSIETDDSTSLASLDAIQAFQSASKAEAERLAMYRCIIASIIESETLYLECLSVIMQYMKAIKATLTTSQPVITEDDFNTMFYKIPELHSLHQNFLDGLKQRTNNWDGRLTIGDHFRIMATHINIYGAFLHNYGRATDTVRKCNASSQQFAEISQHMRMRDGQDATLEDLLHKPVARVQKNALVLHDLLKYTPLSHPDHKTLTDALNMTQHFLDEFNMIQTKTMFPTADRAQRRLVKNSFIVELADGHRKLRHLFLFNDVLACAKYKASGRDKFTFELKWYIALSDIVIFEEPAVEPREANPANLVALKSQACTVRDQILWEEQGDEKRSGARSEKQRKKLADLEAQLVLASPNLVFRVGNRTSARSYTFFLSSEFERTQWVEAIHALQFSQLPLPGTSVSMYELQAWITACRTYLKTNMGSYLLRTGHDESLLVGDLHLTIGDLTTLDQPTNVYVCVEVDSYGHYFRKARTKLICGTDKPKWNEKFTIDLEGSQNLRILLYEESQDRPILRAKCTHKLSRSWLGEDPVAEVLPLSSYKLSVILHFVQSEVTQQRVPTAKTAGQFGAKIQQVCKRQKRPVPFIITACVREVERRGMNEVGIYRVSGSASDLARLKKAFETNPYEAEQLLKDVDVHCVTGILKLYLRELPEALFTDALYPRFLEAFNGNQHAKLHLWLDQLPPHNRNTINFLLAHLIRVYKHESHNKMSLHNLATIFGPTLLRPSKADASRQKDMLAAGTVDVMAQAGILYYFLERQKKSVSP